MLNYLKLLTKLSISNQWNSVRTIKTTATRLNYTLDWSPNAKLSKTLLDRYLSLPMPECKCVIEYVWIDGTGYALRSKARTLDFVPRCAAECPNWSYDGSSTYQAHGENSEVYLIPAALYKDPFRRGNSKLLLCETLDHEKKPTPTNNRFCCMDAVQKTCEFEPQFGLEQEYQLMDYDGRPFGWPAMNGDPQPAGPYYCGVGGRSALGRDMVEAHYKACLYAEVSIEGVNAEVTPSQWEYQIGVCDGIQGCDDLWMGRYIMCRIAEEYGVDISLHPKLFKQWNGAGCHVNFSTNESRKEGGLSALEKYIELLSHKHKEHLAVYDPAGGEFNKLRLTGRHETSSMEVFTHAVANRGVSVRIGREIAEKKRGHLEDRRPSSNCDPYSVVNAVLRTCLLNE